MKVGLDDFVVRHGRAAFEELVQHSIGYMEYEVGGIAQASKDAREAEIGELLRWVALRSSELQADGLLRMLSTRVGRTRGVLERSLRLHRKARVLPFVSGIGSTPEATKDY